MNPMEYNVNSRKSDRANNGMQSVRFGFENYGTNHVKAVQNQLNNGAGCVIKDNRDKYSDGEQHVEEQMQPALDRTLSGRHFIPSGRSNKTIKEIEYFKNKFQREAQIHQLEMEELKRRYEYERDCRKMEKQNLLRIQQAEDLREQLEDDLLENFDEEINTFNINENQRQTSTKEWVNKVPTPQTPLRISQSWHVGDFKSIRHKEPVRIFNNKSEQSSPTQNDLVYNSRIYSDHKHDDIHNRRMYNNNEQSDRMHDDRIQDLKICREPIRHTHENIQTNVLTAAFEALQSREIKDLPTFDGENVLEWPNFISEFRRSTKEYNIKPNKNLRRLNKALKGDARFCVETLLISPENVNEIISHLEMSFGRSEWILQHLVFELRSLPIMDEENIHEFKLFYNKLFGAITTIKNMRAENYMENPELLSCLEKKLPPTTKDYWIHYKANLCRKNIKVNIVQLGDWFKYELDAQYAGLSAKDVINKSYTAAELDNNCNDSYIFDGKEFP